MAVISNTSGAGGAGNIPSSGEMNAYQGKLDKMDTKDLFGELGKNLEPWQKDAVIKEIVDRAQKSGGGEGAGGAQGGQGTQGTGGAQGAGDDDADTDDEFKKLVGKLLKKLANGSISQKEMEELSKMTGVKVEDLEAAKGQSAGGGGSGGDAHDIQGG